MNTSDSKYKAIAALEQFIREGRPVKFPVKGTSMLPFIVGGRDCVEFYPVEGELKVGDIVMARVEEGYPVVHRVIGIEPVAGDASPASFLQMIAASYSRVMEISALRSIACARMLLRRRMLSSVPMAAARVSSRRKRSETGTDGRG